MTSNTAHNEKVAAEKATRIELVKSKLLDGSITALSIDACIFTENGNRIDEGVFKHLEQFKSGDFRLVFSEVSLREVHAHIKKEAEEAKNKLVSSLRSVGKHWSLAESKEIIVEKLIGAESPKDVASKKVANFAKRCGAEIIEATGTVDLKVLLKRYFDTQPPFETSAEKKSEFPDAIAMLSLDGWAERHATSVIFVTKDKGCKRYCAESKFIYALDSLSDALSLIQERDNHCIQLCRAIEAKIADGAYANLDERIADIVGDNIWRIDWEVDASAAYYFEEELHDIELVHANFDCLDGKPSLRAVDYCKDVLVVQSTIEVEIDATCDFSFAVKDGIDHDMVNIGSAYFFVCALNGLRQCLAKIYCFKQAHQRQHLSKFSLFAFAIIWPLRYHYAQQPTPTDSPWHHPRHDVDAGYQQTLVRSTC